MTDLPINRGVREALEDPPPAPFGDDGQPACGPLTAAAGEPTRIPQNILDAMDRIRGDLQPIPAPIADLLPNEQLDTDIPGDADHPMYCEECGSSQNVTFELFVEARTGAHANVPVRHLNHDIVGGWYFSPEFIRTILSPRVTVPFFICHSCDYRWPGNDLEINLP